MTPDSHPEIKVFSQNVCGQHDFVSVIGSQSSFICSHHVTTKDWRHSLSDATYTCQQ